MNIIKDTLGNILLMNGHYVLRKWADIATDLILNGDSVVIKQTGVDDYAMYASDINYYQVLPEKSVYFSGSAAQLLDVLVNNIFSTTTVCVFGCDITEAVDVTYDNAVSGLAATNVQDAIDELAGGVSTEIAYNANLLQNMTALVGTNGTTVANNANDLLFYGFYVKADIVVSQVRLTTSSGSGNFSYALYEPTASGAIGTKIANAAQVAAGTNVTNVITFGTPRTFKKGLYYFGVHNSASVQYYGTIAAQIFPAFGGPLGTAASLTCGYVTTPYNATLPDVIPSLTLVSIPSPNIYFTLVP
jgi:hypothetical protein